MEKFFTRFEHWARLRQADDKENGHVWTDPLLKLLFKADGHEVSHDEAVELIRAHLRIDQRPCGDHQVFQVQLFEVHKSDEHFSQQTP